MTILSVGYPLTPVGRNAVGGSEQILTLLDEAITEAGHHSIVLAAEGSETAGTLIASPGPIDRVDEATRDWARKIHKRLLQEVLEQYPVDLIHMHSLDFHHYLPGGDVPVLATLHLPPDWYPAKIFKSKRKNFFMNCVSRSQSESCPASTRLLDPVLNGVDVARLGGQRTGRSFALSLGRVCPEKGFHFALDAAREADVDFVLAGDVAPYESHVRYFEEEIAPRLDARRRFVGPVGFEGKKDLLLKASCVLIPSTVAETSSLAAMEAMACGTPVIAFRSGALPEIVEDGNTGFIVSDAKQMAEALRRLEHLRPEQCLKAASSRFSASRMTARYLALYRQLATVSAPRPVLLENPKECAAIQ